MIKRYQVPGTRKWKYVDTSSSQLRGKCIVTPRHAVQQHTIAILKLETNSKTASRTPKFQVNSVKYFCMHTSLFEWKQKHNACARTHERKTLIERNKYDFYSQHPETASFLNWVRMVSHFLESAKSVSLSLSLPLGELLRFSSSSSSLLFGQTLISAVLFVFLYWLFTFRLLGWNQSIDTISSVCLFV